MSKITLASSSEVWLINIPGEQFNHFINNDMEGLGLTGCQEVFQDSLAQAKETSGIIQDYEDIIKKEHVDAEAFPVTRSRNRSDMTVSTPAANNILSGGRESAGHETRTITPVLENSRIRWANVPKQPIPELKDINEWIGHQLNHKRMPKEYLEIAPKGHLLTSIKGYPEGLLGIPNKDGSPRIIVPRTQILALVLQTHEDIHHQSHVKVLYVLKPLFYWPGMTKDVENICTACQTCMTASVRRRHLKAKFDPNAPPSTMLPRQDYGIDFYGVQDGEIMVIVDLFTRETILTYLNRRTQDNVAQTLLTHVIFERGVPRSLRTDNAPELSSLRGAVSAICKYLKINQIRTGGHNPRGNSICERVNQSIGSMIRKLTDQEYKQLRKLALPAFQFALNTYYVQFCDWMHTIRSRTRTTSYDNSSSSSPSHERSNHRRRGKRRRRPGRKL